MCDIRCLADLLSEVTLQVSLWVVQVNATANTTRPGTSASDVCLVSTVRRISERRRTARRVRARTVATVSSCWAVMSPASIVLWDTQVSVIEQCPAVDRDYFVTLLYDNNNIWKRVICQNIVWVRVRVRVSIVWWFIFHAIFYHLFSRLAIAALQGWSLVEAFLTQTL